MKNNREGKTMGYDPNNIFAKILRGEMPCHKIYEDQETFAFLDIMPRAKGHTLVLPKKPAVNMLDVDPDSLCAVIRTVRLLTPIIKSAMGADGVVIQQYNEAAAGQTVFHLHFHIIPRYQGVPLKHHGTTPQQDEILAQNATAIRAALEKAGL